MITYLIYGILSLLNNDDEGTIIAFGSLAEGLGKPWITGVMQSYIKIKKGDVTEGLNQLKKISEDPSLSESERQSIKSMIEDVENYLDNLPYFATLKMGNLIFDNISEKINANLKTITQKLKDFSQKMF